MSHSRRDSRFSAAVLSALDAAAGLCAVCRSRFQAHARVVLAVLLNSLFASLNSRRTLREEMAAASAGARGDVLSIPGSQ